MTTVSAPARRPLPGRRPRLPARAAALAASLLIASLILLPALHSSRRRRAPSSSAMSPSPSPSRRGPADGAGARDVQRRRQQQQQQQQQQQEQQQQQQQQQGRRDAEPPPGPSPPPPRTPPSGVSYVVPKRPRPAATGGPERRAPDSVSILTWNVWFGKLRQPERYAAILREVLERDVDVACFQEVTAPFVSALTSSAEVMARYDLSPNRIYHYGCLTIAKKVHSASFEEVELPSRMGRTLIVARTPDVAVGNVHLESLDNELTRRDQLRSAGAALGEDDDGGGLLRATVLVGDFNFDSSQTYGDWRKTEAAAAARKRGPEELENAVLRRELPDWADAWPAVHGTGDGADPGITFDGATNPACVRDKEERMRYDRIMVKMGAAGGAHASSSSSSGLTMEDIVMVGTEPLDETGLKPSDHYGLHITLKLGGQTRE